MLRILAGLFLLASAAPAMAAMPAYLDDRSTPQSLIRSYYNAINRGEYARAYSYYPQDTLPPFTVWAKGYANTQSVEVLTGKALPDPGAGNIYYNLPVAIRSVGKDGKTQIFGGCYVLHITSYGMQTEPPYRPMTIRSGQLRKSTGSLKQALPKSCAP